MTNPSPFVWLRLGNHNYKAEILEATPRGTLWVLVEGYHTATEIDPNQIHSFHIHNPEAVEHVSLTRQQWQKAEPQ